MDNFKQRPGNASTNIFQVVDSQRRKPVGFARVPRELSDSIVARLREHGHAPRTVARESGITIHQTVDILIDRLVEEARNAYIRGYREGYLRPKPPIGPHDPMSQRQAA